MADNSLDPLQALGLMRKSDQSGSQKVAALELLQTTKTNIIMREELAQYSIVVKACYEHLEKPVYKQLVDKKTGEITYERLPGPWHWMEDIRLLCEEYNHNLKGEPREQFIRGLMAVAAQAEIEEKHARSIMDLSVVK